MIAKDRLYLDSSKTKVMLGDEKGIAFLLAGVGQVVPESYESIVREFYSNQSKPDVKRADPINNLTTRSDGGSSEDESPTQTNKHAKKRGRHAKPEP